ncbi:hypothetical protein BGZ63DRAFT_428552 [Mariannaea sp. PMI_226]|nr:hypothetical protein BGZ63DRAFT_428552 [Mariannaea sp. PMI_226]
MKVSASVLLLTAALGVSAHPSGHAHMHKRDFVVAKKPAYNAAAVPPTSAPASSAAKSKSSGGSGGYVEFCSGSNGKRATLDDIMATGNTGTPGHYGCNIMTIPSGIASQYDYTTVFNNAVGKDQACLCWNKIGPDGGLNGFWKGNEAMSFTLPASGSQTVAFQADSQGGCACSVGSSVDTTDMGQYASTWLEFDFGSKRNSGWSGADASCLVSAAGKRHIPALKVCNPAGDQPCSIITTGGGGSNSYVAGTEAADGIGLNIKEKKAHLVVTVGQ